MPEGARRIIAKRYVLESLIGRGAFGDVHRALDRTTGERVAIKELRADPSDHSAAARFDREARLLSSIESPFVVRCLGHGVSEEAGPYLVLEWLDGQDLAERQQSAPLTRREALEVARQAALGLSAVHEAGIVHRDIKPGNFFLLHPRARRDASETQGDLRIKLIDLGIARATGDQALTLDGHWIGTPSYMSPEQARAEETLGPASDLFSLGAVLYEMLSGKRPFRAGDPFAVLAKIVLEDPVPLERVVPELGPEVARLVARAMAKSPAERFASARAMADALGERLASIDAEGEEAFSTTATSIDDDEALTVALTSPGLSVSREQRVVTAVFAKLTAREGRERAIEAFETIAAEHGGECHRILGRRLIAVFGARRSRGDEAVRAARAALIMSQIEGARLALATGKVVSGEGALSGQTIDRGALAVERSDGRISIDGATARLLAGRFALTGEEGQQWLLAADRRTRGRSRPTLLGQSTPTVGRESILALIEATLAECVNDSVARTLLLTGPAGAGKSRVRFEAVARAARGGSPILLLFGRGDPQRAGSPFAMLVDALRRLTGILDGEPVEIRHAKLRKRLSRRLSGEALDRAAEMLGELVDAPAPGEGSLARKAARADPTLMFDAMRAAWEDWLLAETSDQALVIVLEDLHWSDRPTITFVDSALRHLADRPTFVLALARPEVRQAFPDLWASRGISEVRLAPLTKKACERLVRSVLGEAVSDKAVAAVVERAEGNAFYLEELIRALAEGSDDALPETVLGTIQARIDVLGPRARRVLRAASVFGQAFWKGGLLALLGDSAKAHRSSGGLIDRTLDESIAELSDHEMVFERPESRFQGEIELVFRHALLREAAHAMLADDDRVLAHKLAGDWLERAGETDAALLAEHFDQGQDPARATQHYGRAAEQALEGHDFDGALALAERAIACRAAGSAAGGIRLLQAEAHRWKGDFAEAAERAMEAMDALEEGSARWFSAAEEAISSTGRQGLYGVVADLTERVSEPSRAEHPEQLVCLSLASTTLLQAGQYALSDRALEAASRAAESLRDVPARARARLFQARSLQAMHMGDPARGLVEQEAAVRALDEAGDARNGCVERVNLAFPCTELGDYERAAATLTEALAASDRVGLPMVAAYARLNLGHVLAQLGHLAEARDAVESAQREGEKSGDRRLQGGSRCYLASIAHLEGDFQRAFELARESVDILQVAPPSLPRSLAVLARVELALGQRAEALEHATEAMSWIEKLGRIEEGEALVRLSLVETRAATGDLDGARSALRLARDHLLERAARIEDEGWRQRFLSRVFENARTLSLAREWLGEQAD